MTSYETIKASSILGQQILNKLLTNPLSLLDRDKVNRWLATEITENKLVWPADVSLRLSKWIKVLSPIEYVIFYYSVAEVQYRAKFFQKRKGPLTPIGNTVALTALGAGAIAAGAVGGVGYGAAGGAVIAATAADSCSSTVGTVATGIVGGTICTVGGAALVGTVGTLAGAVVAVPCVAIAAKEATYGVVKSLVVWPTSPFDKARSDRLRQIKLMLLDFSKLIDREGDFNENYLKVLRSPQSMGQSLYSLFTQMDSVLSAPGLVASSEFVIGTADKNQAFPPNYNEDILSSSVVAFLKAFQDLVEHQTLVTDGKVFRKVDHIKNLVAHNLGQSIQSYHQIISNAGPSYVDEWVKHWTQQHQAEVEKKQESPGLRSGIHSTEAYRVFREAAVN